MGRLSAGTAPNVIANEAVFSGTVRCFSSEAQQKLCDGLRRLAEETARSYGALAEVEIRHANGAVINNPDEARQVYQLARQMLGEEKAVFTGEPVMGMAGDDFSAFLDRFPGAYAHVGVANPDNPNSSLPLHDCRFEPDEEALVSAAAIHVAYAMHYLT
ncbi:MAG: hypothetical protein LIO81_00720 [Clostridiales bacterium]|nr:hypothetical protein [Clostridiales bacterium]